MTDIPNEIVRKRLIPVAVIERLETAVPLAEALREGGLNVIEVTLRTDAALSAIGAIRSKFPDMVVGAGTVLDAGVVPRLADLGVAFLVSPGLNERVVEAACRFDLAVTPGVVTPTEVEHARALGLQVLKFFPAEPAGGVALLKALAGPFGHTGIRFIPTGGINPGNAATYLSLPSVAAVGGSWFVDRPLISDARFAEVARLTKEALSLVSE